MPARAAVFAARAFFMLKILALPALFFLGCMTTVPSSTDPLACTVEPAGGTRLRFELANRSQAPLRVLTWNTPWEQGWMGTILTVSREGEELPYQGRMTKRGDPAGEDYAEIAAGGRIEATVDLAEVYDVSRPGSYRVEVTGGLLDVTSEAAPRPLDRHQPLPLRCEPVTFARPAGR